jgi:hypothetical protein
MEITNGGGGAKRGRKPRAQRRERNPLEKVRDRRMIARLHLRFQLWTHEEIAAELNRLYYQDEEPTTVYPGEEDSPPHQVEPPNISRVQVTLELKRLRERLDAEATEDILKLRRMRIAEYRELEEYCRERYEATVGKHIKTITTDGEKASTRTEEEELAGEHPYLVLAKQCKDKISELENIVPPRKTALTDPSGTKPFEGFGFNEELKRLAALYGEIGGKPTS